MSENVVEFTGITRLDLPVEKILKRAEEAGLTEIVILGYDADGDEFFSSSLADGGSVLWHLERAKHHLMRCTDDMIDPE